MIDYYEVLQLDESASVADIKAAFRRLSKKYHPDIAQDAESKIRYEDIRQAYAILHDPQQRYAYHEKRWLQKASGQFKKTYTPTTAVEIYKQLLTLEQGSFFADGKLNISASITNELNTILSEKHLQIIEANNDIELNDRIASVTINLITELQLDYIPVLEKKLNQIAVKDRALTLVKMKAKIEEHKKNKRLEKLKPYLTILLLAGLLLLIKLLS